MENADNGGIVWSDRKRIAFGLPWTFTKYTLTKEKLLIHTGMLNTQEDEVRLYRIMDVTLRRSLWERMFGLGTIHCCSADKSTPEFDIAWEFKITRTVDVSVFIVVAVLVVASGTDAADRKGTDAIRSADVELLVIRRFAA